VKITEVTIKIEPALGETKGPVTLHRMPDKGWRAEVLDAGGQPAGPRDRLYHSEMVLALEVQEIIARYNSGGGIKE
jgi:hypothetical protein